MPIQLPSDGVGKFVETNTTDGTNHRQVVTVGDKTTAANTLAINASGQITSNINGTVSVRPTDGTNQISKTFDIDTSGVTHEYVEGISLRKSGSGGSVELGTSTAPLRTDTTGATVQPVSGTFWQATQPVSGTFWQATQPVSGTVTATLSGSIGNTAFGITPATSGGLSISHLVTAATTNAANIKASAGQVFGWSIYNNAAYPVYVKFHNTAGTPTAGAAVVHSIGIQAGTGRDFTSDVGIAFATGIGITVVKDIADAGTTAVAASDAIVEVYYK